MIDADTLDKTGLLLRAGGALALGLVAPTAALFIEIGPGGDVDCKKTSSLALSAPPRSASAAAAAAAGMTGAPGRK